MVVIVGIAAGAVGSLAGARQHAVTAADLAALAAAQSSSADPCWEAERIALANGVLLAACTVEPGGDVWVRVRRDPPELVRRLVAWSGRDAQPVDADARAGPP